MASENDLLHEYKLIHPKSRARSIIINDYSGGINSRRRRCILCDRIVTSWANKYPRPDRSFIEEKEHIEFHTLTLIDTKGDKKFWESR